MRDFGGGPVGVKTIAISAGEEVRTIEEVDNRGGEGHLKNGV